MAEEIGLRAIFDTKTQFNKGLSTYNKGINQANKNTSNFAQKSSKAFTRLGGSVLKLGAIAGGAALVGVGALGVALGAFAVDGIKQAVALEQQMANIAAIMGKTVKEVQPLKDLILELSIDPNLKVSATEAAQAVELLARNGVAATDIIDGMAEGVVALANATGADFGTAADLATDVMALFNEQGATMTNVIDGITGVTTSSKFSVDDYRLAFANFGPVAASLGIELDDVNTLIAGTAQNFDSGSVAGAAFRTIFLKLAAPTAEQATLMDKYGISIFTADGKMRDMGEITQQFNDILQGQATITTSAGGATQKMITAAERARKTMPALTNTIAEQGGDLAILQNELGAVTDMYGEGSPAVDKHKQKILKLSNSLAENQAKLQEQRAAIAAVTNARIKASTETRKLTEEEKANFSAVIGGARGSVALAALSGLTTEEFEKLSGAVNENGQAMAAAATRVDSTKGAFEIFKSIIQGIQIQIGDLFLPTLKQLITNFSKLATTVGPQLISFFQGFISKVSELAQVFQAGGLFGSRSGSFGSEGLLSALGISPETQTIIQNTITGVQNLFSEITTAISAFQTTGVEGEGGVLDSLLNVSSFEELAGTVLTSIPTILGTIVTGITTFLTEQGPVIAETLLVWADTFWGWVDTAIIGAGTALAAIGIAIAAWVTGDGQTQLLELGNTLGQALVDGIAFLFENQEKIAVVVTKIIAGLGIAIVAAAGLIIAVGGQIVAGIIQGMLEKIGIDLQPALLTELGSVFSGMLENVKTSAIAVGTAITDGFSDGILQGIVGIGEAITEVTTAIFLAIGQELGIASPSTVFMQFGVDTIQGFIDGILSMAGSIGEIITGLFSDLDIGGLIGSLFGGGEEGGGLGAMFTFDPATMLEGLSSITLFFTETIPTSVIALSEQFLIFFTSITEQLTALTTGALTTFIFTLSTIYTIHLLTLVTVWIASTAQILAQLQATIAMVNLLIAAMGQAQAAVIALAQSIVTEMKRSASAFKTVGQKIKSDLIPAMKQATSVAESLAAALERVAKASRRAAATSKSSTGTGFNQGLGFAAGTPSNTNGLLGLGFKIPSGSPNDSFGPMFAESGEEMLITPRGTSIESLVFSRLANLLQGSAVQGGSVTNITNNFQMNIKTTSTARDNIRQFDIMKGMVGA